MDILDSLYSFLGTNNPKIVAIDIFIAVILAISLAFLILEVVRIISEHTGKKASPAPVKKPEYRPVEKAPATVKPPEQKPAPAPAPKVQPIEVVKPTLPESVKAMTEKYGLEALTIASQDGLSIASNSKSPDEDAAVYSGAFQEQHSARPDTYYYLDKKAVHMYSDAIKEMRDDTRKIIEKFASGAMKA